MPGNRVVTENQRDRVLVVAAHPDDEVLGAGGTIALLSRTCDVRILLIAEGITSRSGNSSDEQAAQLSELHGNAVKAGEMLGATVTIAGLPDNRLDSVPLLSIIKLIEAEKERFAPTIIFTNFNGDLNLDHRKVFEATMTAARPLPGSSVREVHCFEVFSATEWAFGRVGPAFTPQLFYDISDTLDLKLKALEHYGSEMRPCPHPRSPEAIRAAAVKWGSTVGVPAAEAFVTVRMTRQ